MRLEILRWTRSKRLLIVLVVFVFSGVTSPLLTAYSEEVFSALGGADNIQLVVAAPRWQDAISSYLQNASQLALIFACYLAAWGCSLGPDPQLRIYYLSRVQRAGEVFLPRLTVTVGIVLAGAAVGSALALYITWALFDGVTLGQALGALTVHSLGLVAIATLAACVAWHTNSPGLSAALTYGFVLVADLLRPTEVGAALPSVLARPVELLGPDGLAELGIPLIVTVALLATGLASVLLRPVRQPGASRRADRPALSAVRFGARP